MNINFTDKYLPPEIAAALSNGFLFSQLEEETFAPLYAIVERMYEEYTNANPYRETAICAMLTQICIALLRRCECIPVQKQDSTDAIIQDAILYLQKHFKNPPKKQELARKYHMSANYFGVRFQRAVGLLLYGVPEKPAPAAGCGSAIAFRALCGTDFRAFRFSCADLFYPYIQRTLRYPPSAVQKAL